MACVGETGEAWRREDGVAFGQRCNQRGARRAKACTLHFCGGIRR